MTFESRDTSIHSGEPYYLLLISRADGVSRFTNADEDITYDGDVYTKAEFRVGNFEQGNEPDAGKLEISLPLQSAIVQTMLTIGDQLLGVTDVIIYTGHRDEPEAWIGFAGTVSHITIEDRTTATIEVERYDGLIQKQVPRMTVSQKCQNVLGDHLCQVNLEDFKFESTIDSINLQDARRMVISGLHAEEGEDGTRFIGGRIFRELTPGMGDWVVAGFIQYRGSGDEIVLLDPNPALSGDQAVKLYPGCDRLITTCRARFDNVINFTGLMPLGNPERSIMEGTGFLGYAIEEDTTTQGTTTDPAPRPRG